MRVKRHFAENSLGRLFLEIIPGITPGRRKFSRKLYLGVISIFRQIYVDVIFKKSVLRKNKFLYTGKNENVSREWISNFFITITMS